MAEKIKRIVFFTIDFPPMGGGMSRYSLDAAKILPQIAEEVTLVTLDAGLVSDLPVIPGVKIVRLQGVRADNLFEFYLKHVLIFYRWGLRNCFAKSNLVILVNSWTMAGIAAWWLKLTLGIPYLVFVHGLEMNNPSGSWKVDFLMRRVLKNAAYCLAISRFTQGLIEKKARGSRVWIIHPPLDLTRFPENFSIRRKSNRVILTVARLVEHKGVDMVIRALAKIQADFPDLIYRVVGSGQYERELKALTAELGLKEKVIFLGELKDQQLLEEFQQCDVFVMASRYLPEKGEVEGFGIVYSEAAACHKPVVAGNSGGISDAVVDNHTGILVDPLDPEAIAAALRKFLDYPELARKFGQEGRLRVENEISLPVFKDKLKSLLDKINK